MSNAEYPGPSLLPSHQRAKPKGRGCIIVLAVLGALIAISGVVVGVLAYLIFSSPEGKRAAAGAGELASMTFEATRAPGTKELHALGCPQASVMDSERMQAVTRKLNPDAATKPHAFRFHVVCGAIAGAAPTCDRVASTYRAAVTPAEPFAVSVARLGASRPECDATYAADASKLRDGIDWNE